MIFGKDTGIAPERRQELEEMFEKYSPRF